MYAKVELVAKSYKPLELQIGMLFINNFNVLWKLDHFPLNQESFYVEFGAPVEIVIIDSEKEIASFEQIGLWDDDEESDEYLVIDTEILNLIFQEYDGIVEIKLDEDTGSLILIEKKVVLRAIEIE